MQIFTALAAGLIFGLALILSGMTNPAKILSFLDLAGRWDPSLALVMAGAIAVGLPAFYWAGKRTRTLTGTPMHLPTATHIDRRLILGSLAFGAGWGLAGYCPGPALASLASGGAKPLLFAAAMVAGMVLFDMLERFAASRKPAA